MFFSSLLESLYYEVFPGESSEQQQLQLLVLLNFYVLCTYYVLRITTTAAEFPLLAKCARHILAIPASSATSERFFSAGGLMVSSKRTNVLDGGGSVGGSGSFPQEDEAGV